MAEGYIYDFNGVKKVTQSGETPLMINGSFCSEEVITRNALSLVPLRLIAETYGATVSWDGTTSTVTVNSGETEIVIQIGKSTATIDGKAEPLYTPAILHNDCTYVPLQFIAGSLKKPTWFLLGMAQTGITERFNNLKVKLDTPNSEYFKDMDKTLIQRNLVEIEQQINNTTFIGQVGRYAMFQSAYITLVSE